MCVFIISKGEINMKNPDDILRIRDTLIRELADDPVPAKFVDITKLGLIAVSYTHQMCIRDSFLTSRVHS